MARLGRAYPVSRIMFPPPKSRPPVYDTSAMSASQSSLANNTPFTWGHTVAGNYGIVAVCGQLNSTTDDLRMVREFDWTEFRDRLS